MERFKSFKARVWKRHQTALSKNDFKQDVCIHSSLLLLSDFQYFKICQEGGDPIEVQSCYLRVSISNVTFPRQQDHVTKSPQELRKEPSCRSLAEVDGCREYALPQGEILDDSRAEMSALPGWTYRANMKKHVCLFIRQHDHKLHFMLRGRKKGLDVSVTDVVWNICIMFDTISGYCYKLLSTQHSHIFNGW